MSISLCGLRFRYKLSHSCGAENDVTARECNYCQATLNDADSNPYLEVRYYDCDAQNLSEHIFLAAYLL